MEIVNSNLLNIKVIQGNETIKSILFYDNEKQEIEAYLKNYRDTYPNCIVQISKPMFVNMEE